MTPDTDSQGLRDYAWRLSYSTTSHTSEGRPVDILHEFYVPALKRATQYERVAGYFRSSSLAAASQGFSAFVEHGGTARMVVGSDLDPEDVQAILNADKGKLAAALNQDIDSRGYLVARDQAPRPAPIHPHCQSGGGDRQDGIIEDAVRLGIAPLAPSESHQASCLSFQSKRVRLDVEVNSL